MSLMGPGAMTEYSAPSRGRRARGTVYVDDPAVGFFVAGSSLKEMNGIYTRTDRPSLPKHKVALAYSHSNSTGWYMALCAPKKAVKPKKPKDAVAVRRGPRRDVWFSAISRARGASYRVSLKNCRK